MATAIEKNYSEIAWDMRATSPDSKETFYSEPATQEPQQRQASTITSIFHRVIVERLGYAVSSIISNFKKTEPNPFLSNYIEKSANASILEKPLIEIITTVQKGTCESFLLKEFKIPPSTDPCCEPAREEITNFCASFDLIAKYLPQNLEEISINMPYNSSAKRIWRGLPRMGLGIGLNVADRLLYRKLEGCTTPDQRVERGILWLASKGLVITGATLLTHSAAWATGHNWSYDLSEVATMLVTSQVAGFVLQGGFDLAKSVCGRIYSSL